MHVISHVLFRPRHRRWELFRNGAVSLIKKVTYGDFDTLSTSQ